MAENNKALIFKDGATVGQPSFRRIPDNVRLDVGEGIAPANNLADLALGANLKFDLVNGLPSHKVYNAQLLVNSLSSVSDKPVAEEGFGKFYALDDTGSSSSTLYYLDDVGQSHYLQLDGLDTLSIDPSGSIEVDFDPSKAPIRTVPTASVTSGTLTFSTLLSSLKPGRSVSLRVKNDLQEDLELVYPTDDQNAQIWTWLGGTNPTVLPAGQVAVLSLLCYGDTESSILAAFSYDDSQQITGQGTPDYVAVFEQDRDIRSVKMYFYEEDTDTNTENGYEINKVGLGYWFGPTTDDNNQDTGLITPAASLHVHSNQVQTEPVLKLQSGLNDASNPITSNPGPSFKFFAVDGSPEGVVDGTLGDIASDSTNGNLYFKFADDGVSTGWARLTNQSTQVFTKKTGSLLVANQACYMLEESGAVVVEQATADAVAANNYREARFLGLVVRTLATDSTKVEVQTSGIFESAQFATGSGLTASSVGKPAYLSTSSGQLTTDVSSLPEGDVVAEIGVISKYISANQADVVIQPKAPVVL